MAVRNNKEDALRESEERLRAIFNLAAVGIAQLGTAGHWQRINQKLCDTVGYTADELRKLTIQDITHPGDLEAFLVAVKSLLAGEIGTYAQEMRYIHKSGAIIWVNLAMSLVRDATCVPKYFIAVVQDITPRKQAEEAQRESEEKYAKLFKYAPGPLVIFSTLQEGRLIEVNDAFEKFFKYRKEEVIGRSSIALGLWANQEDRIGVIEALRENGEVRDREYEFRDKTGNTFVGLYAGTIIEIDGEDCLLSIVMDITARKHIEEEHARLASIVASSDDAIIGKSLDGIITDWNSGAEKIFGYSADEAIGEPITILAPPDRLDEMTLVLEKLEKGGRIKHFETVRVTKDDRQIHVSLCISPIVDAKGRVTGASMIARDITEHKRAEKEIEALDKRLSARASELESANQELEAFSYSVSHDLRKPLTVINGYCQVILDMYENTLEEQCKKYLREIYDGTVRMNRLIDALLKFSLLIRSVMRQEQVDLSSMAKAVAADLRLTEPGRRVTFRVAEGITVEGDPNLLRVVMENLIGNAWKYTSKQEESVIEFGMMVVAGLSAYFVRDNGTGFDMAYANKLFIPFQRLPGSDKYRGYGIGLATVGRIIKRHGGRVWAEGEPGRGSTFYFTVQAET